MSRYIPADVRRELRQEANFGCAICGIPIIEYHHIIPYSEREHHDPDHMIALCPNHHRPSDDAAIPRRDLYEFKENPYNNDIVDHMFYYSTELPELEVGRSGILFSEPGEATLLRINGADIIRVRYENNLLNFDVKFYSKSDELIAEIEENDWWADTNSVWDLQYKSKIFKVYNSDEKLGLKVEYDPGTGLISIIGIFRHGGDTVRVSHSRISFPNGSSEMGINHLVGSGDVDSVKEGTPTFIRDFEDGRDRPIIYEVDDGDYWMGGKP